MGGFTVAVPGSFRGAVWFLACLVSACLLASAPGFAQDTTTAAPSPVAPGDLTRPVFDTTKPVYQSGAGLDKAANSMVAQVEGRAITLGDVGDAIKALPKAMAMLPFETLYPGVLDQLIGREALAIRAQNQGLDEDPAVRRKIRGATDGVLEDEYLHREGAKGITEAALLARYKQDYDGKPGPEEVHARIIMLPTEKEANDVIAELKGGADFAAVARRSSKDYTASAGGDLGFVTRDSVNAEIGSVIFAVEPGRLLPFPVRSVGSWFVIKVEERRRGPAPSYAEVHDQLMHVLLQEAATGLVQNAADGMKVRQFDLLGREVGEYTRPAR